MNNTSTSPTNQLLKTLATGIASTAFLLLMMSANSVNAQTLYTENFDMPAGYIAGFPVNSLPMGWSQVKFCNTAPLPYPSYAVSPCVDNDNYWDRMGMGATNSTANPRGGSLPHHAMMRYRTYSINSGERSFLVSKRLDMSSMTPASPACTGSFFLWRDNEPTLGTRLDSLNVFANTVPAMTGTPINIISVAQANLSRYCGAAPASACGAWYQVNFTIPNALGSPFNGSSSVYVIIMGISADGTNTYIDDFSVNTYPNAQQVYVGATAAVMNQNVASTSKGANDQQIIGLTLRVTGAGNPLRIQDMIFNTNGSTNPVGDIVNAKLYFTGAGNFFDPVTAILVDTYNSPWATNFTMLTTPWSGLENGDNYFWLTYDIHPTLATAGNYVDAEWISFKYSMVKNTCTGAAGTTPLTVVAPATISGITSGMAVSGTGIAANTTVNGAPAGTTVTLNTNMLAGGVNGPVTFTIAAAQTPTPQTLTGARMIDIDYCIPNYVVGTAWNNYSNNDYIATVRLPGDVAPGINNLYNTNPRPACTPLCRFSPHPPDYELFSPTANRTAVLTEGSSYTMDVQVGTYGSGNYFAVFFDFDQNGFTVADRVYQSGSLGGSAWVNNIPFNVPSGAIPGNTRMRVREVWISNDIDPCLTYWYGETEDYRVTILPTCAPLWPGWKTWLGFTNDWDNPANWCGGVPTLSDNARIPGFGAGVNDRPGTFAPVIKSGILATARNLRIEANDTIFVNAPTAGSLTVAEDLIVVDNTSSLIVNSTLSDSAQVRNGTLTTPFVSTQNVPFRNSEKTKNIWIYTRDELIAQGMIAGDVVDTIVMHLRRNSNAFPYKNVTIKAWYTDPAFRFNGAPNLAPVPYGNMPPVVGPAPVTIFGPQDVSISAAIPTVGDYGTVKLLLIPGSFAWSGTTNRLVIEMSYDNMTFNTPNQPDPPTFTQTLDIFQSYISVTAANFRNLNYFGGDIVVPFASIPQNSVTAPGIGAITATGANTLQSTYANARFAVGQWVGGTGVHGTAQTVGVSAAGSTTVNVVSAASALIGQYLSAGGGPIITNIVGNQLTVAPALSVAIPNATNLTLRPAITALSSVYPPYATITLSAPLMGAPSGNLNFGANSSGTGTDYRPNLTFKYTRPFQKYPFHVQKNWTNNGTFIPGKSVVNFKKNASLLTFNTIGGDSVTTFFDMNVENDAHTVMARDVIVTDTLYLSLGNLKLNNQLLTLTNSNLGAITIQGTGGRIQSEMDVLASNVSPFGRVNWKMGSVPGTRVLPFVNSSGVDVFFDYNIDSGTHDPIIASYSTAQNNLNIPAPVVSNILGWNPTTGWNADGYAVVDRFYHVNQGPDSLNPQADMTFRYASTEQAQIGNGAMSAQRWVIDPLDPIDSSRWEFPYVPNQFFTPVAMGTSSLEIRDYASFFNEGAPTWWTIVGTSNPLPVTLLDFKATPFRDKVRLDWVTASEMNSSHFIVERTTDNVDFSFIGRVESRGPSTNNLNYQTWDLNPVEGIQYYYLRQYDRDGMKQTYGPVSAKFTYTTFDIVTATVSSTEMGMTVVFTYDSEEPYNYRIMDMTGRVVVSQDRNPATPGLNVIDIDAKLAKGVYQVILQNSEKTVSRKFFY